jgi:hypothetical protein
MEFAHKSDLIGSAVLSLRRNEHRSVFPAPSAHKPDGCVLRARELSINA